MHQKGDHVGPVQVTQFIDAGVVPHPVEIIAHSPRLGIGELLQVHQVHAGHDLAVGVSRVGEVNGVLADHLDGRRASRRISCRSRVDDQHIEPIR